MLLNNKTKFLAGATVALLVVSCSISTGLDAEIEKDIKTTVELKEVAKVPTKVAENDTIRVKDDIWLGDTSDVEYEGAPLPSYLEKPEGITLISKRPITLFEIGDMINKITSIRVSYASQLEDTVRSEASSNKPSGEIEDVDWVEPNKIMLSYRGPLSGLLDEVGSRFGLWWKYTKNEIYFYKQITKTFVLYTLPSKPGLEASVGGSTDGGSGSSSIKMDNNIELEFWSNIQSTISDMIDGESKLSVDASSGTITVTASPNDIKKVAQYINEQNSRMSRQVAISVKVLQVSIADADNYGLDLKAAFKNAGGTITDFGVASASSLIGDDIANNLNISIVKGKWTADGVLKALSTQGNTNLITSGTVTTLNNKPAPLQVVRKETYVSEITKTNSGGSGDYYDVSTETEEIETGFTMNVLPRILEHGRLMMMFNLTLSDLISLDKVYLGQSSCNKTCTSDSDCDGQACISGCCGGAANDGQFIQNPVIESRGFSQEVALKSGESLVLTGYERVENTTSKSGVGSATNSLLGGSAVAEKTRSVLVIILTPVVLESPLSPESRMLNN